MLERSVTIDKFGRIIYYLNSMRCSDGMMISVSHVP